MKRITLIELFAGIGSQHKALSNLGFCVDCFPVEYDKNAVKAYNSIHNTNFDTLDIKQVTAEILPKAAQILTYSFPCQDLTISGQKLGFAGTRSVLLYEVIRILQEFKPHELPQVLVMENVPNLNSKQFKPHFLDLQKTLNSLGYVNFTYLLNSNNFGVPQHRKRLFLVSYLNSSYADFSQVWDDDLNKRKMPLDDIANYLDFSINPQTYAAMVNISPGSEAYYSKCPTIAQISLKTGVNTLSRQFTRTITTKQFTRDCGGLVRYDVNFTKKQPFRVLTPRECFRLMGFTDLDFNPLTTWASNTTLYKLAGNSIVVPVLQDIFSQILSIPKI